MTASISTPRTDALVEPAMDMDGAALLVRFDKLSRLARELEATCGLIAAETRRLAFLEAAEICAKQALEGECPERAHYCAEAIRAKARELRSLHAAVESAHPPAAPEGLERYTVYVGGSYRGMAKTPEGEYVRYDQAAARIAEAERSLHLAVGRMNKAEDALQSERAAIVSIKEELRKVRGLNASVKLNNEDLRRELQSRDATIEQLRAALDSLVMACELPGNHCEIEQAILEALSRLGGREAEKHDAD